MTFILLSSLTKSFNISIINRSLERSLERSARLSNKYTITISSSSSSRSTNLFSTTPDRPSSSWNLKGLQTEITKNLDRTTRKLAKKTQKDASSPSVQNLKDRLSALKTLEFNVGGLMRNDEGVDLEEAVGLALELGLSDEPPEPQKRGPKKQKGPKTVPPRLPYRLYTSLTSTPILVGRRAQDNDVVSTSRDIGERSDFWMHASGCAGSHVVIKNNDPDRETVMDAAVLAARASKCASANKVKVTLTRWGNVSKPAGSKPGLVRINGDVETVRVDLRREEGRLKRLDENEVLE